MSTIPTITDEDIRELVGKQSFQRGQQYFQDDAIFDAFQQGMTLKGHCHGSLPTPYRLQVIFDSTGITGAICNCPAGHQMLKGYYCKHVAALLLTWREQPEKFTKLDPVETLLERRSKGELIALITHMFQKQPELEWELLMPPPTDHKRKNTVDPETYRRQVDEAFSNGGREWDAVYGISSDLYAITSIAAAFLKQNDYANAAIIYEVVARETLGYYLSYHDEDGALGRVIKDCVEELSNCLASEQEDEAARQRIIETIFAVYRFDIDKGGFGLTDDIPPELLQHTTPEEKRIIADWVRTIISNIQGTETSDNWHRKRYGGLLLSLEAEILDDEEFLRIGRETNRVHEVVKRLLERGRVDEAVQDAEQVRDLDLVKLAELFLQYGQDAAAERMLQTRSKQTQNKYVPQWLKNYYLARNNYAAALVGQLANKSQLRMFCLSLVSHF